MSTTTIPMYVVNILCHNFQGSAKILETVLFSTKENAKAYICKYMLTSLFEEFRVLKKKGYNPTTFTLRETPQNFSVVIDGQTWKFLLSKNFSSEMYDIYENFTNVHEGNISLSYKEIVLQ